MENLNTKVIKLNQEEINEMNQVNLLEMVELIKGKNSLAFFQEQQRIITMNRPEHFQDVLFEVAEIPLHCKKQNLEKAFQYYDEDGQPQIKFDEDVDFKINLKRYND